MSVGQVGADRGIEGIAVEAFEDAPDRRVRRRAAPVEQVDGGRRTLPGSRCGRGRPTRRVRRCSSRPRGSRRRRRAGSRSGSTSGPAASGGRAPSRGRGAGRRGCRVRAAPASRARQGSERIHQQARDAFVMVWLQHHNDHEPRACLAMRPSLFRSGSSHHHRTRQALTRHGQLARAVRMGWKKPLLSLVLHSSSANPASRTKSVSCCRVRAQ